ncbi:MAG: hypothetical protein Q4F83_09345, partial [Eubacteriales bacterium]|nr:hypothetical protein [Eubacteriales bacterium]
MKKERLRRFLAFVMAGLLVLGIFPNESYLGYLTGIVTAEEGEETSVETPAEEPVEISEEAPTEIPAEGSVEIPEE